MIMNPPKRRRIYGQSCCGNHGFIEPTPHAAGPRPRGESCGHDIKEQIEPVEGTLYTPHLVSKPGGLSYFLHVISFHVVDESSSSSENQNQTKPEIPNLTKSCLSRNRETSINLEPCSLVACTVQSSLAQSCSPSPSSQKSSLSVANCFESYFTSVIHPQQLDFRYADPETSLSRQNQESSNQYTSRTRDTNQVDGVLSFWTASDYPVELSTKPANLTGKNLELVNSYHHDQESESHNLESRTCHQEARSLEFRTSTPVTRSRILESRPRSSACERSAHTRTSVFTSCYRFGCEIGSNGRKHVVRPP